MFERKLFVIVLAALSVLALAACGGAGTPVLWNLAHESGS
jgi:hypothetical protein